jgi:acyl-CoA hydrolase
MTRLETVDPLDAAVDLILSRAGPQVSLAAPLGLGKPNRLVNAVYRRVVADPARQLTLYTALSLDPPVARGNLERRFLDPFVERHFGADYPRLDYIGALREGRLPANVSVREFYFQPGSLLASARAQQDYTSINYTAVARDLVDRGIDAIVHLVARRGSGGAMRYSLSSNPDVTLDLLDAIAAAGKARPLLIGVVHPGLPFLGGAADVAPEMFDQVIDDDPPQPLFALPRDPIDATEHAIGLNASTLVRDGGTLQLGIGALSDALVHALILRQQDTTTWADALTALGGSDPRADARVARIGGSAPLEHGLAGVSEMVMDGFMHLRRAGILTRLAGDGTQSGGHYLKGAFYLGSRPFHDWLRGLSGADYDGLAMSRVSEVNRLRGADAAHERAHARFFNDCMIATALGTAVSDTLADGRVVSGVGGQHDFVAMAQALPGARSVLMLHATRRHGRRVESNIRWNYAAATIPRHLRDLFVTEYGVADLRGQSDAECIRAMLAITDARFQESLAADARRAGKLPRDFRLDEAWRANTPERVTRALAPFRARGRFEAFPFGSDFSVVEQRLLPALAWLAQASADPRHWPRLAAGLLAPGAWAGDHDPAAGTSACLARLGLARRGQGLRARVLARLVRAALAHTASAAP